MNKKEIEHLFIPLFIEEKGKYFSPVVDFRKNSGPEYEAEIAKIKTIFIPKTYCYKQGLFFPDTLRDDVKIYFVDNQYVIEENFPEEILNFLKDKEVYYEIEDFMYLMLIENYHVTDW